MKTRDILHCSLLSTILPTNAKSRHTVLIMSSESVHNAECRARRNIETAWYAKHNALKQIFNGKSKAIMYPHIAEQYAMIKRGEYVRNKHVDSLILETHGTCIRKPRTSRSALRKLDMHALFTIFTYTWYACEMQNIYDDICKHVQINYDGKLVDTSPNECIETDKFAILFSDMRFARESYMKRYGPRNFSVANRRDDFRPCNGSHAALVTYNIICYVANDNLGFNSLGEKSIAGQPLLRELPYGEVCEYDPKKSYVKIRGKLHGHTIMDYIKCTEIEKYETPPLHIDRDNGEYFNTYDEYRTWLPMWHFFDRNTSN